LAAPVGIETGFEISEIFRIPSDESLSQNILLGAVGEG
jgi:hypothetical protein